MEINHIGFGNAADARQFHKAHGGQLLLGDNGDAIWFPHQQRPDLIIRAVAKAGISGVLDQGQAGRHQ